MENIEFQYTSLSNKAGLGARYEVALIRGDNILFSQINMSIMDGYTPPTLENVLQVLPFMSFKEITEATGAKINKRQYEREHRKVLNFFTPEEIEMYK